MAIALDKPLDTSLQESVAFLAGLQGNILKSHGRDYAAHVFCTLGGDARAAREWLADFTRKQVTTGVRQKVTRDAWMAAPGGDPGVLFSSVGLSYTGYVALGVVDGATPNDSFFRLGMKQQALSPRPFNDSPVTEWEAAYQQRADALIILAHDDEAQLKAAVEAVVQGLASISAATWVQYGERLEVTFPGEAACTTIEHFGYEDGISNPVFYVDDIEKERAARGFSKWDPAAGLNLALVAEPGFPERFGSYLVFRKLEQDVAGFKKATEELTKLIGGDVVADDVGALAVGRKKNGAPIIPVSGGTDPNANDFYFLTDDRDGKVCPFHAHIRKTNPRGDTTRLETPPGVDPLTPEQERSFRIVRRGITYGKRPDLDEGSGLPLPSAGVGLLFMSCQARLAQFAIQQEGSDSNDFIETGVGPDAVIGQNGNAVAQEWPKGSEVRYAMANFVKLLGGEYFFVPSMEFLRTLDENS